MLLDDEKNVFELIFKEDLIPKKSSKIKLYSTSTNFLLNNEMVHDLKTRNFVKLRLYTDKGYIQKDIPEKHQKVIQNAINCLE